MVTVLEDARAAVAHDLADPAHDEAVEEAVEHRRWWLEQWPDGAELVLCLLAQDVQEAVHRVDPMWPVCVETSCVERFGHPMFVQPDLGTDPFWTCSRTGLPVAPVGSLSG